MRITLEDGRIRYKPLHFDAVTSTSDNHKHAADLVAQALYCHDSLERFLDERSVYEETLRPQLFLYACELQAQAAAKRRRDQAGRHRRREYTTQDEAFVRTQHSKAEAVSYAEVTRNVNISCCAMNIQVQPATTLMKK